MYNTWLYLHLHAVIRAPRCLKFFDCVFVGNSCSFYLHPTPAPAHMDKNIEHFSDVFQSFIVFHTSGSIFINFCCEQFIHWSYLKHEEATWSSEFPNSSKSFLKKRAVSMFTPVEGERVKSCEFHQHHNTMVRGSEFEWINGEWITKLYYAFETIQMNEQRCCRDRTVHVSKASSTWKQSYVSDLQPKGPAIVLHVWLLTIKHDYSVHPKNFTCPLKMGQFKRKVVLQPRFFRGHVSFRGSFSSAASQLQMSHDSWVFKEQRNPSKTPWKNSGLGTRLLLYGTASKQVLLVSGSVIG